MKSNIVSLAASLLMLLSLSACHKEAPYLETQPIFDESVMIRHCARVLTVGWGLDEVDSVFAPEVKIHSADGPDLSGIEAMRKQIVELHTSFPDLKATLEEVFSDSDRVFVRYSLHGTQRGSFLGYGPSGKTFTIDAFDYGRVKHRRLTEYWSYVDRLSILRQLGLSGQAAKQ